MRTAGEAAAVLCTVMVDFHLVNCRANTSVGPFCHFELIKYFTVLF